MDRLSNQVRNYAWGSTSAIPQILGVQSDGQPQAELWLGAHPDCPSSLASSGRPLDRVIADDPRGVLGQGVSDRFGARLPFLLKILAAEAPLSLQVHPDQTRASAGFAAEEAAGVPADAAHRNYKDPNHKPELVVALTPFDALCGFRDPAATLAVLHGLDVDGLDALRQDLGIPEPSAGLEAAFTRVLMGGPDGRHLVDDVARACARRLADGSRYPMEDATVVELALAYPGDPGVVVALLLNRVTLLPGQALFLPAGNVHAYLRGTAVEVMASSDNVLRGGLTPKHVDVAELLHVVDFRPSAVPYLRAVVAGPATTFAPDVAEFQLDVLRLDGEASVAVRGPCIVLCLDGRVTARSSLKELTLKGGDSLLVEARDEGVAITGSGTAVAAAVPRLADAS